MKCNDLFLLLTTVLSGSWWCLNVAVGATPCGPLPADAIAYDRVVSADVIVAGGSTAALAAAFAAAEEGAHTVLLEPTDWIGGQLTASGVPAIDEAWHQIVDEQTGEILLNVSRIARDAANMTPAFLDMLADMGNPGRGWVSNPCQIR